MQSGQASRSALLAAANRAAHQVLERGAIFSDPLALRILGVGAQTAVDEASNDPAHRQLRLFIAFRTRFAEDALAIALTRGVRQIVVLGAGLDTYAYRSTPPMGVRIFEVDHPATQAWKRECLAAATIRVPRALAYVPIDFEQATLASGLAAAGFDPARQTFFTWLGVVPYLSEYAIFTTLRFIAELAGGAHVVFDYANPLTVSADRSELAVRHAALAARVASFGEAFRSYFETDRLKERLLTLGFREVEDLGPERIAARYFFERATSLSNSGGHVVRATTA